MRAKRLVPSALLALALLLAACGGGQPVDSYGTPIGSAAPAVSEPAGPFIISSEGVVNGALSNAYGLRVDPETGETVSTSPPIAFRDVPPATESIALVFEDPDSLMDAGYLQVLWLAANIGAGTAGLPANASATGEVPMVQGSNHAGTAGYIGPEALDGTPHTCLFTAYALDTTLSLEPGFTQAELEAAIDGHVLDKATLEATVNFGRAGLAG